MELVDPVSTGPGGGGRAQAVTRVSRFPKILPSWGDVKRTTSSTSPSFTGMVSMVAAASVRGGTVLERGREGGRGGEEREGRRKDGEREGGRGGEEREGRRKDGEREGGRGAEEREGSRGEGGEKEGWREGGREGRRKRHPFAIPDGSQSCPCLCVCVCLCSRDLCRGVLNVAVPQQLKLAVAQ